MKKGRVKLFIILVILLAWNILHAQEIYYTRDGLIHFYSSTPVEDIEASNNGVNSVLNTTTGEIQFSVLIIGFNFKKQLMQEHFNEKFMESEKFPKATFKGKIKDPEAVSFSSDGEYPVEVSGEITIHGITKDLETGGVIKVDGKAMTAESEFHLAPADFEMKIPSVVRNNIAKEIKVTVKANYQPFTRN